MPKRRVCAWCQTTIGLVIAPGMVKNTHGICEACAAIWLAPLRARKAA